MNLRLALVAFLLAPSVGCTWLRDNMGIKDRDQNKGGPIAKVSADHLVTYLNGQADRLQSVSYGEVSVAAKEGWKPLPTLRGNLAASQPRHFRMVAEGGAIAAKVDMGSNPELFWVSVRIPTQQPLFVYASHSDFETGKAKLPGGVPFEPEWVMQALGMTKLPVGGDYRVDVDDKTRTYKLSWPAKTPNGMDVRKEIIFAVDDADASRNQPQVKKHLVRDSRGTVICSAEVRSAKTFPTGGTDPQTKRPYVAQYPTEVVLRWEEQRFEMTLDLKGATVNQTMTPQDMDRLFRLPDASRAGVNPINLAEARFDMPRK
jgi:hypothetical protein